jgi:DNA-binding LacI/PurR family transcriptional regulator
VRHALNSLTEEGYLYRIRGKGTFVSPFPKKDLAADIIAIVIPSQQTGTMFSEIVIGSQKGAVSKGFDLIYSNSNDSALVEAEYIEQLKKKVKGFIIFLTDDYARWDVSKKTIQALKHERIPFVLIDRYMPDLNSDFVGTDNFAGACAAVNELTRKNYENIACVICNDWKERSALRERLEGYKKAIKENQKKAMIIEIERTKTKAPELLDFLQKEKNAGIFTAESLDAVKIMEFAVDKKLKIPEDIGIVGFDKPEEYTPIPMSFVEQPMMEIGIKAAKLLIDRINGENSIRRNIRIKPELILNRSVRNGGEEVKRRAS